jgi:hypothetical protein
VRTALPTLWFIAAGPVLALSIGCSSQPATSPSNTIQSAAVGGGNDLAQALDSLRKMAAGGDAGSRTLFYLNQWLNRGQAVEGEWKPDRLVANIPRALRVTPGLDALEQLEFMQRGPEPKDQLKPQDLIHLQQALWLHDIASRARREPPPAELALWLKELEQSVGVSEAEQLAAAERLFDWAIRNVQLNELPQQPKGPVATAGEGTDPVVPAMTGEVGPGYGHTPIQLLVQGRGDAHERGRLFIQLCRQAGVDAVMLGRIDERESSTPQPWAPAALVGKELYLFDAELGLPIPGPNRRGIATLSQVLSDPAVLRQLDLAGGPAYPHSPTTLKNLVALIDAEPEALSRRMALLQKAMPGARRLVVSIEPSRLDPRLRQCKGIGGVSLWRVPLEAIVYQIARQIVGQSDPAKVLEFNREEAIFHIPESPLIKGRNLHLQGRFENRDQLLGARSYYLGCRTPDEQRQLIYTSDEYRRASGFTDNLPTDEQEKQMVLETIVMRFDRMKQHATYWLGLTYFESGNYAVAIEWLDERTLGAKLPSPWVAGARYNLARCYEALGDREETLAMEAERSQEEDLIGHRTKATAHWERARQILAADDSPQRHGNRLRAAWLTERIADQSPMKP